MSNRASFIFGRALPLGVFGFLVAIQGELAFAGIQHALTHGDLDGAGTMYLLTRLLALFAVYLAAQIVRTVFEERILRNTYPQYEAYAAHTRRLIPFVF